MFVLFTRAPLTLHTCARLLCTCINTFMHRHTYIINSHSHSRGHRIRIWSHRSEFPMTCMSPFHVVCDGCTKALFTSLNPGIFSIDKYMSTEDGGIGHGQLIKLISRTSYTCSVCIDIRVCKQYVINRI